MNLLQLKFGGIFNRQHAFGVVDERRQCVQRGGFTRTRTTRYDDVQAARNGCLQIGSHFFGKGAKFNQITDREFLFLEFPNGNKTAIHRDRWHHGVETGPISKPRIDVRVTFIHPPAHGRYDLVDDPEQMAFVFESDVGQHQFTCTFDENAVRTVYQNIVDGFVFQKGFQRTKAHHFVIKFLIQDGAVIFGQRNAHLIQRFRRDGGDFHLQAGLGRFFQRGKVQVFQQALVQLYLQLHQAVFALLFLFGGNDFGRPFWHGNRATVCAVWHGRF